MEAIPVQSYTDGMRCVNGMNGPDSMVLFSISACEFTIELKRKVSDD